MLELSIKPGTKEVVLSGDHDSEVSSVVRPWASSSFNAASTAGFLMS